MSYQNLLAAFEDASLEDNCGLVEKINDPSACFRSDDHGRETFDCTIHCKDWKWRSTTDRKRVSIILHIDETIRRQDRALLSSCVQVNYLQVENGQSEFLQAFHFDYNPCQRDHALFHAQISNDCIELTDPAHLQALKIDFNLPGPRPKCVRNARIPTCDMTFPSVLVALAADHIGGEHFNTFRNRASELQEEMPLPLIEKLRKSLKAESRDLRSTHWFAHFP